MIAKGTKMAPHTAIGAEIASARQKKLVGATTALKMLTVCMRTDIVNVLRVIAGLFMIALIRDMRTKRE